MKASEFIVGFLLVFLVALSFQGCISKKGSSYQSSNAGVLTPLETEQLISALRKAMTRTSDDDSDTVKNVIERAQDALRGGTLRTPLDQTIVIGYERFLVGDYTGSVSAFYRALELDPDNPTIKEDYKRSIKAMREFQMQETIKKILDHAEKLFEKGRYKEAARAYEDILELNPDHTEANEKLQEIVKQIGKQK